MGSCSSLSARPGAGCSSRLPFASAAPTPSAFAEVALPGVRVKRTLGANTKGRCHVGSCSGSRMMESDLASLTFDAASTRVVRGKAQQAIASVAEQPTKALAAGLLAPRTASVVMV